MIANKFRIILCSIIIITFPVLLTAQNISGIINIYQKVFHYDFCRNSVTVGDVTGYAIGDKVLLIQMKGAEVDTTNTTISGTILDYESAGNYEFAIVSNIINDEIFLRDSVTRTYEDSGAIQLIKVPVYNGNVTVTDTLKCKPWDGESGGIIVLEVNGNLTLNAPISVKGCGFRGGVVFTCNANFVGTGPSYVMPSIVGDHVKGEGISILPQHLLGGRGTVANGGGAGGAQPMQSGLTDAFYNGGGGGGNFGAGGDGGKSSTGLSPQYPGGVGGRTVTYSNVIKKIFMGGGGGAGHRRYDTSGPTNGTNGGGCVIIKAQSLTGNNKDIIADGIDNLSVLNNVGRGGGGAGGTVLLEVQNYVGNINITAKGGKGGDNSGSNQVGPGGGGGGGFIWVNQNIFPSNISYVLDSGATGMHTSSGTQWGATAGQSGGTLTGLSLIQTSNALFVPVSVATYIVSNSPLCIGDTLLLSTGPVPPSVLYNWEGPNGFSSNIQNPSIENITISESGTYSLELISMGCPGPKTFADVYVGVYPASPATTNDTVCTGNPNPPLYAVGNNINWYADSTLNVLLASDTVYYPTVSSVGTHIFYVTQADSACESAASESHLVVLPSPLPPHTSNQTICFGDPVQPLIATANGIISWYADSTLNTLLATNDTLISNEVNPGFYYYYTNVFDTVYNCTSPTVEVILTIIPDPYAIASNDTSICEGDSINITVDAFVYSSFLWSTGDTLQQIYISPVGTTQYYVTVDNGCGIAEDSLTVFVNPLPNANAGTDTSVCFGQSVNLTASGGISYLWSNNTGNTSTVLVTPLTNTNYIVTVTDNNNCTNTDDVNVIVLNLPQINITGDSIICEGSQTTLIVSGGVLYNWSNGINTAENTIAPTNSESYSVTVTNADNCQDSSTFDVFVQNTFYVTITSNFAPEHNITEGQIITFTAAPSNYQNYKFFINNELKQSSSSNIYSTGAIVSNSIVSVTAFENGCPSEGDSLLVKVTVLPNAFTPFEGDGINETFAKGLDLTILNKWGQELYKGTDGWNGEYKSQKVSPGTYFYIIEINKGTTDAKILTGTVNLVVK